MTGSTMRTAAMLCLGLTLNAFGAEAAPKPPVGREAGWTGNVVKNPGFEEDFVNGRGEGHVLSFKGDWYYNQKDLVPDYWAYKGGWSVVEKSPHSGRRCLMLAEGATVLQNYPGAVYQDGGSAWAGATNVAIKADNTKIKRAWRASIWVRGGAGSISIGGVKATAVASPEWQLLTVELPAEKAPHGLNMGVTLTGPGEFDDVVVQEQKADDANLMPNSGFEESDKDGRPTGWSTQRKYRAIGPTYYVWTDWNHWFRETRGEVRVDPLISFAGKQSLRFDVYPGDEKYVESDLINVNQAAPGMIEVGVWVRADRIMIFDIRLVDNEGAPMLGVYPISPENGGGGSSMYGNGTFGWRYIRKFFATPLNANAVKAFRVRLAARGFNAHTLDDAGTRSYCCQTGTVWWDNLTVTERGANAAAMQARGAKVQPDPAFDQEGAAADADLDLGERLYGTNTLGLGFTAAKEGSYRIRVTTTLPGASPVVTESEKVKAKKGEQIDLKADYNITQLVGDLKDQGKLRVELLRDSKKEAIADATYSFNTWPVVIDFDVSRSYSLPTENPVTTSLNLGVASGTLAKVAKLDLFLADARDTSKVVQPVTTYTDLKQAYAETLKGIADKTYPDKEFNMPTPATSVDRTNLIMLKLDLSKLKVWPHDYPVRDTVLVARGVDSSGQVLFEDKSDPFGRMEQTPKQDPIKSVEVREDGAILINGEPRYLFGASHQNNRTSHSPALMEQLGFMGLRLESGMTLEQMASMYSQYGRYLIQAKPADKQGSTQPVVTLTDEQKAALTAFVAKPGSQDGIVSYNTGGWEGTINFNDPATVAKHIETNDFIRQTTKRPVAISTGGAYTAWWLPEAKYYDIDHAETEMWGPMDFNVIFTPYMKREKKTPTAWVYLPQLYDNTPHERYRFETYENIIRGSAGVEMIQGIGDPSFNRGLDGELRYLEKPLNSLEKAPEVTFDPYISHKVTEYKDKTYILATNSGPIIMGNWKWDTTTKQSGAASHEGDTVNTSWFRPSGIRIHGFRGLSMPELIQKGDKIVQYVWLDPKETPDWVMVAVRGDGRFAHNAVLGKFEYEKFREQYGNVIMYSELDHSAWHLINWVCDDETYNLALKYVGKAWADRTKKIADAGRAAVDAATYKPEHFHNAGDRPAAGQWVRIEMDAEQYGLVGKLVDGFAYLTQNGRALWDYSALERDGKPVRVFCEDTTGIDRALLKSVKIGVPGLKKGDKVKALFENREITADDGAFTDNFEGVETYGYEGWAIEGDVFGFVKDPNRELGRMLPSGYGYKYGPTSVHIYEIKR
ncbi:MAG: hypothetical protein K8S99_04680 [Planctomycetes bacterium]|nr:hypothetical protein [Planctomycetota bacterium]